MKKEIFLQFEQVSKQYNSFLAVDKLSFNVYKGDIFGFLGPNGAGKSTSIRMALSLIKPTSGKINLFGSDILNDREKTLSKVGALIEKPDFYSYLSAQKNLEILGEISAVQGLKAKIDEVLDLVGLTSRRNSKVKTFSQGMKQRLGIAQTLLHDPKLIILDEPANGLDPQGQVDMRELIVRINKERGITVIISSHILNEVEQICNRMVIINKGKSVVEGDVSELLTGSRMKVSYVTDDNEQTLALLSNSEFKDNINGIEKEKLTLLMEHENIPRLNDFLSKEGVKVYSIEPIRSLEEYFITMTK
ncbi:MAG: ABC transporter ATP-binding protein [Candidatus Kapaibacterium sp.]|nr:ABC transporter ATP-binding protein [Ignavibacteria bacterium]